MLNSSGANMGLENEIACVYVPLLPNFSMHHEIFPELVEVLEDLG